MRDDEAGFTLMEMIVVVAVLALVATLVLARGPSRSPALDLRAASSELSAFLRRARTEAIENDRDVRVLVSPDGRSYGTAPPRPVPPDPDPDPDAADAPTPEAAAAADTRTLPARVLVSRDAEGRLPPPITFHPDGSATGGRLLLTEDGRKRAVAVDWLTGAVSAS